MRGSVRQRTARGKLCGWEYTVDCGSRPAQRCAACDKRTWLDGAAPIETCGCGGALVETLERRRKYLGGFSTKAAAHKAMRAELVRLDAGADPYFEKTTVREFAAMWVAHIEQQGRLRYGTVRAYKQQMRQFVEPVIGHLELVKVRPAHIQHVLDALRSKRSPRTVAHVRSACSAMFGHAVKLQLIPINPVHGTESPAKQKPEHRTPTAAELRTLIDATVGTAWEMPTLLCATTGARRGEILGLRWSSVDLEHGSISITEGLHYIDGEPRWLPPKTRSSVRVVPLLPEVVVRLRQHRVEQRQRLLALGIRTGDEQTVCDRGDGTPIVPSSFSHALVRIAKSVGLDGVHVHSLRHGVATVLASSGNRPELTSRLLGHSDIATTLQLYTHVHDDELVGSVELFGRALDGGAQ